MCSTLFLYISLPLFCTTTTWNLQKLLSYTFYGGNVVRVLVHFFFTSAHFHLALVAASISHFFFFTSAHFHLALEAASISHFVTATTKFSCCSSNKKMSPLFFSSRSRSLSPLKPGFHMSEKSQTFGDFAFCRPSQILPIYRIIARSQSQILERRHVSLW